LTIEEKKASILGHHLKVIVTTLMPFAQKQKDPQLQREVISVLETLINEDVEAELGSNIALLDPFDDNPIFAEINRVYYKLRGEYTLVSEIERFIFVWKSGGTSGSFSASSVALSTRLAALKHLKAQLRTSKKELNLLLKAAQAVPSNSNAALSQVENLTQATSPTQPGNGRNLVDRLIWELVQLCAPRNDESIKQIAGECLGELGAVDPYAISFSFMGQTEPNAFVRLTNEQQIGVAKRTVLTMLNSYLNDSDILFEGCVVHFWW